MYSIYFHLYKERNIIYQISVINVMPNSSFYVIWIQTICTFVFAFRDKGNVCMKCNKINYISL